MNLFICSGQFLFTSFRLDSFEYLLVKFEEKNALRLFMVSTIRIYRTHFGLASHWHLIKRMKIITFDLNRAFEFIQRTMTCRQMINEERSLIRWVLLFDAIVHCGRQMYRNILRWHLEFLGIFAIETFSLVPKTKLFPLDFFGNLNKSTKYAENYTCTNAIRIQCNVYNFRLIFDAIQFHTCSFMFIRRIITSCLLIRACAELNANITRYDTAVYYTQATLSLSWLFTCVCVLIIRKGNWKIVWVSGAHTVHVYNFVIVSRDSRILLFLSLLHHAYTQTLALSLASPSTASTFISFSFHRIWYAIVQTRLTVYLRAA